MADDFWFAALCSKGDKILPSSSTLEGEKSFLDAITISTFRLASPFVADMEGKERLCL